VRRSPHSPLAGRLLRCGWWLPLVALASLALAEPLAAPPLRAQEAGSAEDIVSSPISLETVRGLLARGDAAAARGDLTEARRLYDQARDLSRRLLGFYRDLSGAFRGLDARIPREMDQKGRETLQVLAQTNLRLAALFRRQNQPEVAVPLLVEVVKVMTPVSEEGRQAYQSLVEIGFARTPYTAGQAASGGS
jgi:DNA-binding PucR family transcriptional regulator